MLGDGKCCAEIKAILETGCLLYTEWMLVLFPKEGGTGLRRSRGLGWPCFFGNAMRYPGGDVRPEF